MRADIFDKVGHSESNSSARRDFWKDSVVFISRGAEEGRKESGGDGQEKAISGSLLCSELIL